MRKVLLLLTVVAAFSLSSCEKGEEVLPIETGATGGGIDLLSPSRPVTKATGGGIDLLSPSRPTTKATGGGIDLLSPSK